MRKVLPPGALVSMLLAIGMIAVTAGAAEADDSDYFSRLERDAKLRASEERRFDTMRQRWSEQAREREVLRQRQGPAVRRAKPPVDRLSSKLHPITTPLGHVGPRAEARADKHHRLLTPRGDRVVGEDVRGFGSRDQR